MENQIDKTSGERNETVFTQGLIQQFGKFLIIPQCLRDFLAELGFGKEDE